MPRPTVNVRSERPRLWVRNSERTAFIQRVTDASRWKSEYDNQVKPLADNYLGKSAAQLVSDDISGPDVVTTTLGLVGFVTGNTAYTRKAVDVALEMRSRGVQSGSHTLMRWVIALATAFDFGFDLMTSTERTNLKDFMVAHSIDTGVPAELFTGASGLNQMAQFARGVALEGFHSSATTSLNASLDFWFGNGTAAQSGGTEPGRLEVQRHFGANGANHQGGHYAYRNHWWEIGFFLHWMKTATDYDPVVQDAAIATVRQGWRWNLWNMRGEADPHVEGHQDTVRITAPLYPDSHGWGDAFIAGAGGDGAKYANWRYETCVAAHGRNSKYIAIDVLLNPRLAADAAVHPGAGGVASYFDFDPPGVFFWRQGLADAVTDWEMDKSVEVRVNAWEHYHLQHRHLDGGSMAVWVGRDQVQLAPSGRYFTPLTNDHIYNWYHRSCSQSGVPLVVAGQDYDYFGAQADDDGGQQYRKYDSGTNRSGSRPYTIDYMLEDEGGDAWKIRTARSTEPDTTHPKWVGHYNDITPAYLKRHDSTPVVTKCEVADLIIERTEENGLAGPVILRYIRVTKANSSHRFIVPFHHFACATDTPGWNATGFYGEGKCYYEIHNKANYTITRTTRGSLNGDGWGADQFKQFGEGVNHPPNSGEGPRSTEQDLYKRESIYVEPSSPSATEVLVMVIRPQKASDAAPTALTFFDDATDFGVTVNGETFKINKTTFAMTGPGDSPADPTGGPVSEQLEVDAEVTDTEWDLGGTATTAVDAVNSDDDAAYMTSDVVDEQQRWSFANPATFPAGATEIGVRIGLRLKGAVATQETLAPESVVSGEDDWSVTGTADKVEAIATLDDSKYIHETTYQDLERYRFANPLIIPGGSTITSVRMLVRSKSFDGETSGTIQASLRFSSGGGEIFSVPIQADWQTHDSGAMPRPGGGAWSVADLDDLEVRFRHLSEGKHRGVSFLQIVVDWEGTGGGSGTLTGELILSGNTTPFSVPVPAIFEDALTAQLARPGGGSWAVADLDDIELRITTPASIEHQVSRVFALAEGITAEGVPVADFVGVPRSIVEGQSVQFTDLSTGAPDTWSWDPGDGSDPLTTKNPVHVYATAGTYDVELTASNGSGMDTETKLAYIVVAAAPTPPSANFTADDANVPVGTTVQFADTSVGSITSWLWDFGDGGTSTEQNPTHQYTAIGTYTVKLTVNGTATETKTNFVQVFEEDVEEPNNPPLDYTQGGGGSTPFSELIEMVAVGADRQIVLEMGQQGTGTQWTVGGTASDAVDAIDHDDDDAYMLETTSTEAHRYKVIDPTGAPNNEDAEAVIANLYIRGRLWRASGTDNVSFRAFQSGGPQAGQTQTLDGTPTTYTSTPFARPLGGDWVMGDFDNVDGSDFQAIIRKEGATGEVRCSRLQVLLDIDETTWVHGGTASDPLDAVTTDGDGSYIEAAGDNQIHVFKNDDPAEFDDTGTIEGVYVVLRVQRQAGTTDLLDVGLRLGANEEVLDAGTLSGSFQELVVGPFDRPGGGSWTHEDIENTDADDLRVFLKVNGATGDTIRVSRLQLRVDGSTAGGGGDNYGAHRCVTRRVSL